jgi:hypothetical protein
LYDPSSRMVRSSRAPICRVRSYGGGQPLLF